MSTESPDHQLNLPPKPERPAPEECCGGGCVPCVYDYYYDAMAKWQATVDKLRAEAKAS
ncbi:oxidoreductase-like domain-containing protein [Arenicella xantha]|uniref:Oxidoreductase family protein n=1 Tax=Arenicella xantha TaxID=644221 RepID=A0A395JGJ5_9GAMM|nr:oxidoreductase-like domain-containing protein [Arenicella xantha]RBP48861.1 oxidoreductase family protein [Arenicella xantha]